MGGANWGDEEEIEIETDNLIGEENQIHTGQDQSHEEREQSSDIFVPPS